MTDKTSRSAFIPLLLLVGIVVLIGLFLLFVPLVECRCVRVEGRELKIEHYQPFVVEPRVEERKLKIEHYQPFVVEPQDSLCPVCGDSGKVPLLNIWRRE